MEKIKIRKADVGDMLTVYEQICELEEYTFEINAFQKIFYHNIKVENILYYIAENKTGDCLGYISCHIQFLLHHCGKVAEIQELIVSKPYRGKGIGEKLVAHVEQLLKALDCVSFEVTAQNKRKKTHDFYSNVGFKQSHLKFTRNID